MRKGLHIIRAMFPEVDLDSQQVAAPVVLARQDKGSVLADLGGYTLEEGAHSRCARVIFATINGRQHLGWQYCFRL